MDKALLEAITGIVSSIVPRAVVEAFKGFFSKTVLTIQGKPVDRWFSAQPVLAAGAIDSEIDVESAIGGPASYLYLFSTVACELHLTCAKVGVEGGYEKEKQVGEGLLALVDTEFENMRITKARLVPTAACTLTIFASR